MAEFIEAGDSSFVSGQDDYHLADQLIAGQFARGINITIGRGGPQGRFGLVQKELVFPEGGVSNIYRDVRTWEAIFRSGKFQALIPYRSGNQDYAIVIVSGYFFRIDIDTNVVAILNDGDKPRTNQYASRVQWSLAGQYIVVFDAPDYPILINGETITRANPNNEINGSPAPEVPVSILGTFNQDRLVVSNLAYQFTMGDPVGEIGNVNPPITFAEVLVPSAPYFGQSFSLGTQYANEPITAMGFLQAVDTSTGIGPLFVATGKSVHTFRTDLPRSAWGGSGNSTFGSLFVFSAGIVGPQAFANVNGDLFFLSAGGWLRSISMSRDEQGKWTKTPLSLQVSSFLIYNDPSLATYAFVRYWKNRIFVSANPYRFKAVTLDQSYIADYANGGMVSFNLDNVSTFNQPQPPAWEGCWTGMNPMDACSAGNDRFFVLGKDESNRTTFFEMIEGQGYDIINGKRKRFRSRIETREYDWGQPSSLKTEHSIVLGLEDLQGDVDVTVRRRPSHSSTWVDWRSWKHNAPTFQCSGMPKFPNGLEPQTLRSVDLRSAEKGNPGCDPVSGQSLTTMRKEQYQIDITAEGFTLGDFFTRVNPQVRKQDDPADCVPREPVYVQSQCDDSWKR
jgi:hypothetical protein